MMIGWGESLLIWALLPYDINFGEVISLNLFALALGGLTGLIASFIAMFAHNLFDKMGRFDRDIHRTSWAFSLAVALIVFVIIIFGEWRLTTRIILAFALTIIAFFILYRFSKKLLFKKRGAGRITLEVFLVIFLLVYFLKHPGFINDVPLSTPIHPHIFVFDIPNFTTGDEAAAVLHDCFLEECGGGLINFLWAFAAVSDDLKNQKAIIQALSDSTYHNLLNLLADFDYHLGNFSINANLIKTRGTTFNIVDDQSYSIKSKLALFKLFSGILPSLDLDGLLARAEGYSPDGYRTPAKLNEHIMKWINQERDDKPFFLFIEYAPLPLGKGGIESDGKTALKELLYFMNKSKLLANSLIFFSSFSGEELRRPLMLYHYDAVSNQTVSDIAVSQLDITTTIISEIDYSKPSSGFTLDLKRIFDREIPLNRPVFAWKEGFDEGKIPIMVCSYPWLLEKPESGVQRLINLKNDPQQSINLLQEYPAQGEIMLEMISAPLETAPSLEIMDAAMGK